MPRLAEMQGLTVASVVPSSFTQIWGAAGREESRTCVWAALCSQLICSLSSSSKQLQVAGLKEYETRQGRLYVGICALSPKIKRLWKELELIVLSRIRSHLAISCLKPNAGISCRIREQCCRIGSRKQDPTLLLRLCRIRSPFPLPRMTEENRMELYRKRADIRFDEW